MTVYKHAVSLYCTWLLPYERVTCPSHLAALTSK